MKYRKERARSNMSSYGKQCLIQENSFRRETAQEMNYVKEDEQRPEMQCKVNKC